MRKPISRDTRGAPAGGISHKGRPGLPLDLFHRCGTNL